MQRTRSGSRLGWRRPSGPARSVTHAGAAQRECDRRCGRVAPAEQRDHLAHPGGETGHDGRRDGDTSDHDQGVGERIGQVLAQSVAAAVRAEAAAAVVGVPLRGLETKTPPVGVVALAVAVP